MQKILVPTIIVGGLALFCFTTLATKTHRTSPSCESHLVTIQHNQVTPYRTHGHPCDTLTITNLDPQSRLIAFGEHEHHQPYGSFSEQWLRPGTSLTITLKETGIFSFHDHIQDTVQGLLVVNK